jgi:hypothetical protein
MASLSNQPKGELQMLVAYRRALTSYLHPVLIVSWLVLAAYCSMALANTWLVWPMLMAFASFFSASQVYGRLVGYRGQLLPDYRQVHLAVLATVSVAMLAVLTIGMHAWPGSAAVPIGTMVLGCTAGCWAIRRAVSVLLLLVSPLVLRWGLSVEALQTVLARLESPAVNWSLVVAGTLLLALFARWMWSLTEDDAPAARLAREVRRSGPAESELSFLFRLAERRGLSAGSLYLGLAETFLRLRDWRFAMELKWWPAACAWNTRRWLLAWPREGLVFQIFIALAWTAIFPPLLLRWYPAAHPHPSPILPLGQLFILMMFLPTLLSRRRTLGIESLRPVTRGQFLKQHGAGLLAQWFTSVLLAIGILWLLVSRQQFLPQADTRGFINLAVLVAATELTLFAIFAWMLRYKSLRAGAVAIAIAAGMQSARRRSAMTSWRKRARRISPPGGR